MRRLACAVALALLTTSCGRVHRADPPPDAAQGLFDAGLAQLAAGSQPAAFATLARDYPGNPWTNRARRVQTLAETAAATHRDEREHCARRLADAETGERELRLQVEALTANGAALRDEGARGAAENSACAARLQQLQTAHAGLLEDLEQLRNLTIEMELRR